MSAPVFVDSTVLVFARDAGEPAKQPRAAAWLERLWREQLGRTSMQALSEYYLIVTRQCDPGLAPAEAWDDVVALLAWRPQPVDDILMLCGRDIERRYGLNWWDSLIIGAAQLQGCPLLLSESFEDGRAYGGVTVRSPFLLGADASTAEYVAVQAAAPAPRHPPRGRPRRSARGSP